MLERDRRHPLSAVRLANPVVRRVLGSRVHRLLSGRLIVLCYRGRRSGRTFRIPVRYAETEDGRLVVVATWPERKLWWRSFDDGTDAIVILRRRTVPVRGTRVTRSEREAALAGYLATYPRAARLVRDAVVVVLTPSR
jgi:hypothetical protein